MAALVGVVTALALLALLEPMNSGAGFERTTAASGFGWMLPIMLGLITAMLARSLISDGRHRSDEVQNRSERCAACGGTVLAGWRLCPHCGAPLRDEDPEALGC